MALAAAARRGYWMPAWRRWRHFRARSMPQGTAPGEGGGATCHAVPGQRALRRWTWAGERLESVVTVGLTVSGGRCGPRSGQMGGRRSPVRWTVMPGGDRTSGDGTVQWWRWWCVVRSGWQRDGALRAIKHLTEYPQQQQVSDVAGSVIQDSHLLLKAILFGPPTLDCRCRSFLCFFFFTWIWVPSKK